MNHRGISELELACNEALKQLYPAGTPDEISLRLTKEMGNLLESGPDVVDSFLLFKELCDAAKSTCCKLLLSSAEMNSLLVYLLGDHELNPMPAHYYCPHCGFYHEEPKAIAGIDLPMKICPQCGKPLRRDGFSLREVFVWAAGRTPSFEYRAPKRFHKVAQKVLKRHYAGQGRAVVPCGWDNNQDCPGITEFGWLVMPSGRTFEDYPTMQCVTIDGKDCLYCDYDQIKREGIKHVLFLDSDLLDRLDAVQWESGILSTEIQLNDPGSITCRDLIKADILSPEERQALNSQKPVTFQGMADCISAAHNTWEDICRQELISFSEFSESAAFKNCPICTRDDAFDFLRTMYEDEEKAFRDTENLRKGKCRHTPEEYITSDMPENFRALARYTSYLSPRAYGQQILLQYLRLAKYLKLDRRAYSRAVWGSAGPTKAY